MAAPAEARPSTSPAELTRIHALTLAHLQTEIPTFLASCAKLPLEEVTHFETDAPTSAFHGYVTHWLRNDGSELQDELFVGRRGTDEDPTEQTHIHHTVKDARKNIVLEEGFRFTHDSQFYFQYEKGKPQQQFIYPNEQGVHVLENLEDCLSDAEDVLTALARAPHTYAEQIS